MVDVKILTVVCNNSTMLIRITTYKYIKIPMLYIYIYIYIYKYVHACVCTYILVSCIYGCTYNLCVCFLSLCIATNVFTYKDMLVLMYILMYFWVGICLYVLCFIYVIYFYMFICEYA